MRKKPQTQEFAELIKIVCPSKSDWNISSSSRKNFVLLSTQIDKIYFNQRKIIQSLGVLKWPFLINILFPIFPKIEQISAIFHDKVYLTTIKYCLMDTALTDPPSMSPSLPQLRHLVECQCDLALLKSRRNWTHSETNEAFLSSGLFIASALPL